MDILGTAAGQARRSRTPRGSAYIGRVGGLAVALGVGAALLGGAGIACADSGASSSSAGSSSAKTTGSAASQKSSSSKPRHSGAARTGSPAIQSPPNHKGALSDARSLPATPAAATNASGTLTSGAVTQSGTPAQSEAVPASDPVGAVSVGAAAAPQQNPVTAIMTAIGGLLAPLWSPFVGNAAPNAPVLVIASDDGASTVNVVVSP
jgi:hypothetical protein